MGLDIVNNLFVMDTVVMQTNRKLTLTLNKQKSYQLELLEFQTLNLRSVNTFQWNSIIVWQTAGFVHLHNAAFQYFSTANSWLLCIYTPVPMLVQESSII